MKEEIIAFENLAKTLKTSIGIIKILDETLLKANRKRTLRNFKIEKRISDLEAELLENFYDDGSICGSCWKNPDTCEGSHCDLRIDEFLTEMSKDQLTRKAFEVFGDKFYSFSRRVKNNLIR